MKTAITVLQEMMMKLGETPEYECISQSGPQHQATFEYRCCAHGLVATATARSKKEAKQEAARALLMRLAATGAAVPPPYGAAVPPPYGAGAAAASPAPEPPSVDARSYVALLKELCVEYRLPAAEFELVGDTGPPHLRHFTVRAAVGRHERLATATTKKAARQLAADALYHYLRDNLRTTRDFVEEEALVRAHERVMERYRAPRDEPARPRLAQRPADYHLGLADTCATDEQMYRSQGLEKSSSSPEGDVIADGFFRNKSPERRTEATLRGRRIKYACQDESARALALEALQSTRAQPGEVALGCAASALGVELAWDELAREGPPLHVVTLAPAAPPLAFAGATRDAAAAAAARYLRRALPAPAPAPAPALLL